MWFYIVFALIIIGSLIWDKYQEKKEIEFWKERDRRKREEWEKNWRFLYEE